MEAQDLSSTASNIGNTVAALGLEQYALELETNGLTIIPPDVHGFPMAKLDAMLDYILQKSEELMGCSFSVAKGPEQSLAFRDAEVPFKELAATEQKQFTISGLTLTERIFRDAIVNPVVIALVQHLIGAQDTRLSSSLSMQKWHDKVCYGPGLGLHCDQSDVPLPWAQALTVNATWLLTDYTQDNGCLAYVPASHKRGARPEHQDDAADAVPAEAPKGSIVLFHGALWHGAYPNLLESMRIAVINYYHHHAVTAQEAIKFFMSPEQAKDCDNPELLHQLIGFDDMFPAKPEPFPTAVTQS